MMPEVVGAHSDWGFHMVPYAMGEVHGSGLGVVEAA